MKITGSCDVDLVVISSLQSFYARKVMFFLHIMSREIGNL
jgi:hypothetical protein